MTNYNARIIAVKKYVSKKGVLTKQQYFLLAKTLIRVKKLSSYFK